MKAVIQNRYGPPNILRVEEVKRPVPGDKDILVRIDATAVTTADGMMRRGRPFIGRLILGVTKPKKPIPGTEFAGEVAAVGKDVTLFKDGDQVFGTSDIEFGAHAEYKIIPEDGVLIKQPSGIGSEEAVAETEGFLTALPFLTISGKIKKGDRVLINGASGSVGSSAVQIAKYLGATVTGVCGSLNVEMVKSLGADRVIDYTKEDFTKADEQYDIIFDVIGKSSFAKCKNVLTPHGIYMSAVLKLGLLLQMLWTSLFSRKKAKFQATGLRPHQEKIKNLMLLQELNENGTIKPIIDRRFPLEQIIDAHKYVATGHKVGSVVVTIDHGGKSDEFTSQ